MSFTVDLFIDLLSDLDLPDFLFLKKVQLLLYRGDITNDVQSHSEVNYFKNTTSATTELHTLKKLKVSASVYWANDEHSS